MKSTILALATLSLSLPSFAQESYRCVNSKGKDFILIEQDNKTESLKATLLLKFELVESDEDVFDFVAKVRSKSMKATFDRQNLTLKYSSGRKSWELECIED